MNSIAYPSLNDAIQLLTILVVASVIFFQTTYLWGWKGALVSVAVLTITGSIAFYWLVTLGLSFRNANASHISSGRMLLEASISFLLPALISLVAFAWLAGMLMDAIKSGKLPGLPLLVVTVLLYSSPLWLYLYQSIKLNWQFTRFIRVTVHVLSPRTLPIHIKEIAFQTSDTKQQKIFSLHGKDYSRDFPEGINEEYRMYSTGSILIPARSDLFFLSWDSFAEKRHYADSFLLQKEKVDIYRESYWGAGGNLQPGQKSIADLYIVIRSMGRADLLMKKGQDRLFIVDYYDIAYEPLKRRDDTGNAPDSSEFVLNDRSFPAWDQAGEPYEWRLDLGDFPDIKRVTVTTARLNRHVRNTKTFANFQNLPLPISFDLYSPETGKHYSVEIDRMTLYAIMNDLRQGKGEDKFTFKFRNKGGEVIRYSNPKSGSAPNFELEVVSRHKKRSRLIPIEFH